ncbi:MAG: glucosyl-3-phosphoglycerate synthase [Chloroflexota bacterium]
MMGETSLTADVLEHLDQLGSADIVVGIPSFRNAATIPHVVQAASAGLTQYFPELRSVLVNSDGGSPDATRDLVLSTACPEYVEEVVLSPTAHHLPRVTFTYCGTPGKGSALRAIFEIARRLNVKACVIVDSDLRSIGPEWVELLAGPILKGGYDYVAPLYARHKYDGTITNNIAYPVTRALYGRRIRQPIGGDFGLSDDLLATLLDSDSSPRSEPALWDDDVARFGIDIWLTTMALTGGFAIAQARLGAKIHDPKDPAADLGPMFRQVVGTIFRLAGRFQDKWSRIYGSHRVPEYGFERHLEPPAIKVDADPLHQRFRGSVEEMRSRWEQALRPALYAEVVAASRRSDPGNYLSPELWAGIVYDFLCDYHRRPAEERSGMIDALTPLYLERVASFVVQTADSDAEEAERLIEQQAEEFERQKPYLRAKMLGSGGQGTGDESLGTDPQSLASVPPPSAVLAMPETESRPYKVLVPLANPRTAGDLVRVAVGAVGSSWGRTGPSIGRPSPSDETTGGHAIALGVVEVPEHRSLSEGALLARRQRRLLQQVADLGPWQIEFRPAIRIARHAWEGIKEAVIEEKPDLVVLGWHQPTDESAAIFGTTFDHLVRELACDLAVVRHSKPRSAPQEKAGGERWRRILVPARGGPHARLALRLALRLARHYGSSVTLLHVDIIGSPERRATDLRSFEDLIASFPGLPGVDVRQVEARSLEEGILSEAAGYQLIIMGAAARPEGDGRYVLGAIPEAIAAKAEATVVAVKTREAIDPSSFVVPSLPVSEIVDRWFAQNTYHHREFSDLKELLALKRRQGLTISLGLPTLNEAQTIEEILRTIKGTLKDEVPLLDEIVVIDSGSTDDTVRIATSLDVPVYQHAEILPEVGSYRGKGEALWKSLHVLRGDIIVWVDTDIRNMHPKFVYGLIGPLLHQPRLQYVKGFYQRPIRIDGTLHHTGGGRVTELTARPLTNLFFPELAGLIQPLSGEYAGRRAALEAVPFFTGYGVEIGLLIDLLSRFGLSALGQVDLDVRIHRNQSLADLSRMAFAISQVVISRLEREKRVHLSTEVNRAMKLIVQKRHRYSLDERVITDVERPPMITIPAYLERRQRLSIAEGRNL